MLACAGAGAGWLASVWRVSEVRIVGLRTLSPNAVAAAAGLRGGERLLLTRLGVVERRVERLPEVWRARARRALWTRVVIDVSERDAVALLEADAALAVDREGVVFRRTGSQTLPSVSGVERKLDRGARLRGAIVSFLRDFALFPDAFRGEVATIRAGELMTLVLRDGVEIRFGRPDRLPAKAMAALAVLAEAQDRGAKLQYVDVRSPSTPVAAEAPTLTPTPTAMPTAMPTARATSAPGSAGRAHARSPAPTTARAPTSRPATR